MPVDFSKIPSPCFVLDERKLIANLEKLKSVQDAAGIEIILALKGYALWHTFPLIKKYLKGATASSLNEAMLIHEKMQCKAHTYAPVYTNGEFSDLIKLSSHITFNSIAQWDRFKGEIESEHKDVLCGLRINPEYSEVDTALYNPGSKESRLGVRAGQMPENLPAGITGLHFHLLCENNSFVLERTLKAVEEKFGHWLKKISWFNMGGGHLITHKDYDTKHLIDVLKKFKNSYPNLNTLTLEPGGAIGWQTGYLLATVEDIVDNDTFKTAMLDCSFAAHMPDCLEMPYKPKITGATDAQAHRTAYRMGGNTCLAGDFMGMGDYSFDKELKAGDKIVFEDMIHYTMVKTTFFNGVKHPSIGIWTNDNKFILIKELNYKDYKNKLS